MSRLALIGVTGAAVVVVAAGLIYAIAQQEGDEAADADRPDAPAIATPGTAAPDVAPATGSSAMVNAAVAPAAGDIAGAPSFDVVRINPNGDAVIAGRAAPGARVLLLDDGKTIGEAKADDRGDWVLLPNSAIAPGEHRFTLQVERPGSAPLQSQRMVIVVVPAPAKDIAGNAVTAPAGALALSVPQNGDGPSQILNMPSSGPLEDLAENLAAGTVAVPTLDVIDFDADGRMTLAGRAPANSKIALYLDDKLLGSAEADARGRWGFVPAGTLAAGRHELRVDQVDETGKVIARIAQPIEQPDFTALTLNSTQIVVQPGNSLWRLARRTYGDGLRFSVIYEANKGRVRDPDLIYPGQVLVLPK